MVFSWQKEHIERIKKNELKDTQEAKKKNRKDRKRSKCKKQDAFIRDEGTQYQSQGFYVQDSKTNKGSGKKTKRK